MPGSCTVITMTVYLSTLHHCEIMVLCVCQIPPKLRPCLLYLITSQLRPCLAAADISEGTKKTVKCLKVLTHGKTSQKAELLQLYHGRNRVRNLSCIMLILLMMSSLKMAASGSKCRVEIKPISRLPKFFFRLHLACSDGCHIYIPHLEYCI